MTAQSQEWTHPSVLLFAQANDPIQTMIQRIRDVVTQAMDHGWSGPPYDPISLAEHFLDLDIRATDDVPEARTIPTSKGPCIEFNPNRPRERRRYSVAHEIAHTLFPDCMERVRNRGSTHDKADSSDWQLEILCNLGAAEILMPIGSLPALEPENLDIDLLVKLRPRFDVSFEAVILRAVAVADFSCAAFTSSRIPNSDRFQLDYVIGSAQWVKYFRRGTVLPVSSHVRECNAIGFTAKNDEDWGMGLMRTECVGIPPFPWSVHPRVAGILLPSDVSSKHQELITYVTGNALTPRGSGRKIIAQVVNDATPNWGGKGFAVALAHQWPEVQRDFRQWVSEARSNLRLGHVHFFSKDSDVTVASMTAQKGYGDSAKRRIRYTALQRCLEELAEYAVSHSATVHMPRIGTGYGGGSWHVIEEIIRNTLTSRRVKVTVYDLPGDKQKPATLDLFSQ